MYAKTMAKPLRGINSMAIDMMFACRWPGNVRELENCIQTRRTAVGRACIAQRVSGSIPFQTQGKRSRNDRTAEPVGRSRENAARSMAFRGGSCWYSPRRSAFLRQEREFPRFLRQSCRTS